jgi:CubicO group peptidase (beta-lactamase class C family)
MARPVRLGPTTTALTLCLVATIGSRPLFTQDPGPLLRERVVAERNSPSIVAAIVDDHGTRFVAHGTRSKLNGAAASDQNTVFEIGSISKVFTGILLAEAVKRGEVGLDDPIARYLPKGVKTPRYNGKEITLLNLIWHTSGLPFKPDNLNPSHPENPWADYTTARLYEFLGRYELKHEPPVEFDFRRFEYSNLGVGLLGHILSRRAGMDYETLVRDRILRPLGMNDTAIQLTPRMKAHLATPYNADGDRTSNWEVPHLEGGGGLRSTASDMAKFIAANLGFATAGSVALTDARRLTWNKGTIREGKLTRDGSNLLYHGGSTGGYVSIVAVDTTRRKGVFVASNSQGPVEDIAFHVLDDSFPLVPMPPARQSISLSEAILNQYVGEYHLPDVNLTVAVSREGRRLFLQQPGEARAGLFAISETQFFLRVVDASVTFTKDASGGVTGLVLHQRGDHVGKRIK